jgi:hypothetical protein
VPTEIERGWKFALPAVPHGSETLTRNQLSNQDREIREMLKNVAILDPQDRSRIGNRHKSYRPDSTVNNA